MRKGEISMVMWLVLGLMVLIAVIIVILALKDKSLGIIDVIRGAT